MYVWAEWGMRGLLPRDRFPRCAFFLDEGAAGLEAGAGTGLGTDFARLGVCSPDDVDAVVGPGAAAPVLATGESDESGGRIAEANCKEVCRIIAAGHFDGSCQVPAGS